MRHPRNGFFLVLAMTIMAGLVMMVLLLAAMLKVEGSLAAASSAHQRARLNALVAARLATAQLQTLLGHDQRVTARMDLLDGTKAGTSLNTNLRSKSATSAAPDKHAWTGVWATGGVDQAKVRDWMVTDPDKRIFLGYLVSADPGTGGEIANMTASSQLKTTEVAPMADLLRGVAAPSEVRSTSVQLLKRGQAALAPPRVSWPVRRAA